MYAHAELARPNVRTLLLMALNQFAQALIRLSDTKRQDITFVGFQFWLLGMSIVAVRAFLRFSTTSAHTRVCRF